MANLTKNTFSGGSAVQSLVAAAAGGDTVQNYTGKDLITVRNGHATLPRTVTFLNQESCNQGYAHSTDFAIVVAALTTRQFSLPGPVSRWKDSNGHLQITYSDSAADLTVGVVTLPA